MAHQILIVDDEKGILTSLSGILEDEGYTVSTAETWREGKRLLQQEEYALVFLDLWLPDEDGLEVLQEIRRQYPQTLVIVISGHGTIETAVRATKLGAYNYIEKPLSLDKVVLMVHHALRERDLEQENLLLRQAVARQYELIGVSPAIQRIQEEIRMAGPTQSRVLITGDNGTGKELVARAIHLHSPRRDKPFVDLNCAAIPEHLIESELFGHERGAFTGAVGPKPGRFELAHQGTLFLDEVGDMSLQTQAKVLRVLQEQAFQRVGGVRTIRVDVRILAATNKNLLEEIRKGRFREDLYYRLNVIPIHIPPLRERPEDIPVLVEHFMEEIAQQLGRTRRKVFLPEALSVLQDYPWPGNVRELKNLVERVAIMIPHTEIRASDIRRLLGRTWEEVPDVFRERFASLREARAAFERYYIRRSLEEHGWNVTRTAEALGLERSHLHRKMKLLGIEEGGEGWTRS